MKHYVGDRTIDGVKVTVDGAPLDPCMNVMEFTKNGFEWSYEGPEPRQLALALLVDHLGDKDKAKAAVELFMQAVVANFGNGLRCPPPPGMMVQQVPRRLSRM